MSIKTVSVSLGEEELAWARRKAAQEGSSLSAVVSNALRRERKLEAMDRLLAELGTDDIAAEDVAGVLREFRSGARAV